MLSQWINEKWFLLTQKMWSCLPCPGLGKSSYNKVVCCSVAKACLTLCNAVDCSMPGSSVLHCLPEFVQIHVKSMMPSIHLILGHPFFCLQSFPISWSFPMSSLLASGGLSFGQRASCVSWKQRPVFQATSSPKAHDLHKPSQAFCLIWIISWEIPDKKSWVLRMGRELRHLPM